MADDSSSESSGGRDAVVTVEHRAPRDGIWSAAHSAPLHAGCTTTLRAEGLKEECGSQAATRACGAAKLATGEGTGGRQGRRDKGEIDPRFGSGRGGIVRRKECRPHSDARRDRERVHSEPWRAGPWRSRRPARTGLRKERDRVPEGTCRCRPWDGRARFWALRLRRAARHRWQPRRERRRAAACNGHGGLRLVARIRPDTGGRCSRGSRRVACST